MSEAITPETPDDEPAVDEQPYEWGKCTVRLSIIFHPDDESEDGRPITLGCNTHQDPPIFESTREAELGILPSAIIGLLEKLKQRLPEQAEIAKSRRQADAEAAKKRELEQQQAKARAEAARQRSQIKQNRRQAPLPTPAKENSPATTLFDIDVQSPAEQSGTAVPVTGNQQTLFD
jgi:hypothetical protein